MKIKDLFKTLFNRKKESENVEDNTPPKRHRFMDQYPTQKSPEEVAKDNASKKRNIYYELKGTKYKIPDTFTFSYFEQLDSNNNDANYISLSTQDGVNYLIQRDKMTPENTNKMLNSILDLSLNEIGQQLSIINEISPEAKVLEAFGPLSRKAHANLDIAEHITQEGNVERANEFLEKITPEVLGFYQDLMKNDLSQEQGR